MNDRLAEKKINPMTHALRAIGRSTLNGYDKFIAGVCFLGGMSILLGQFFRWTIMSMVRPDVRFRRPALIYQMVRVGVRSISIIVLVQMFIGIILVLQMAPTLEMYGQLSSVANIIGIAVFRELGPLITAVVLSGFAGASIAAEIGAMVEAEEIKALRAHALNPINYLVVPRVLATVLMMVALTVISDVMGVVGGFTTAVGALGIDAQVYIQNTQAALTAKDFITGLIKSGIFGLQISMIACYLGLKVTGGAEGVGRATTQTVVLSIVSLIAMDCLFTAMFYIFGF
jgi:phospholipid/cholesterol/gamma-HCH transport system permease protein